MALRTPEIDEEKIRDALVRILASPDFDASERNRKFLTYVVEETLAGRSDRIKGYSVATMAFGRSEDFDPQADPVVRIEALRLRRAIERYYLTSGSRDPVRILIPKGTYVPVFLRRDDERGPEVEGGPAETAHSDVCQPSIHVRRFRGDVDAGEGIANGFTRHVIGALTRFADLSVYDADEDAGSGISKGTDFLLEGNVSEVAGRFRVDALLTDAGSGRYLWAESLEGAIEPESALSIRDDFAARLARRIAQPYGIIFANRVMESTQRRAGRVTAEDAVVQFYRYCRSFDRTLHAEARASLEQILIGDPNNAEAVACLSLVYVDMFRFDYDHQGVPDPLARALALAYKAVELGPQASRSHQALGLALWFSRDFDGGLEALKTGMNLNPNDTELMADLGLRRVIRGDWARGRMLIERAYDQNPALPGSFRIGLALEAFAHGRFDEALAQARRIAAPDVIYDPLMIAASAARLGEREEACRAISNILAIDPCYAARIEQDLSGRGLPPDMVRALADALRLAGLRSGA